MNSSTESDLIPSIESDDFRFTSNFLASHSSAAFSSISQLNITIDQWLPNITEVIAVMAPLKTFPTTVTTNINSNNSSSISSTSGHLHLDWRLVFVVTPFAFVFFAAILGNLLVIITIAIDRRMRTVTNAFLLNLAVADLLLGIFCMPFTLLGFIMRHFMFGAFMCKLVSYLQAVSVCVSSWTLVTMSVERYYAICQPFRSKSERQTWSHAYKMIGVLWALSLLLMFPIAYLSELQPTREPDKFKCRERWPSDQHLIAFTILLDVLLFLIPLLVMTGAYSRIILHLRGLVGLSHSHSLQHSIRRTASFSTQIESNANGHRPSIQLNKLNNQTSENDLKTSSVVPTLPSSTAESRPPIMSISLDSTTSTKDLNDNEAPVTTSTRLHSESSSGPQLSSTFVVHQSLGERSSGDSVDSSLINTSKPLQSILHVSNVNTPRPPKKLHLMTPTESLSFGDSAFVSTNDQSYTNGELNSALNRISNANQTDNYKESTESVRHQDSQSIASSQTRSTVQLRSSVDRHLAEKRQSHVLRMLVTVIVEFFICWTPLHVINLLSLYYPQVVYQAIGYDGLSFLYWLAYVSTCTNPITYCFMNRRFRQSFRALFTCPGYQNDTNTSGRRSNYTAHASSSRL